MGFKKISHDASNGLEIIQGKEVFFAFYLKLKPNNEIIFGYT